MKNSKKIIIVLIVLIIALTLFGSTFAYLNWQTSEEQKTNVVFTLEQDFWCAADGGGDITSDDVVIAPTSCTNSNHAIMRKVTITPTISRENLEIGMDLWLNIDSIDSAFSNSENLMYALTTNPASCDQGAISRGNFNGLSAGNKVQILEKTFSATTTETYYLWIWLDAEEASSSTIQKSFKFSIGGNCTDTPQDNKFYAVYSADDTSLRFYKEDENVISVGNTYNGRTTTAVYKMSGYDNFNLASNILPPWSEYADDITTIVFEDKISPNNVQFWFVNLTNVKSVDVTNLDTSKLTSMRALFYKTGEMASELTITGLSNLDTSNVVEMTGVFYHTGENASFVDIGDLSQWDVSNATNMFGMFRYAGYNATTFVLGGLNNWDVSNVNDMFQMFYYTGYNTNWQQDLSDWNVSKVTSHDDFNTGVESKVIAPTWIS